MLQHRLRDTHHECPGQASVALELPDQVRQEAKAAAGHREAGGSHWTIRSVRGTGQAVREHPGVDPLGGERIAQHQDVADRSRLHLAPALVQVGAVADRDRQATGGDEHPDTHLEGQQRQQDERQEQQYTASARGRPVGRGRRGHQNWK